MEFITLLLPIGGMALGFSLGYGFAASNIARLRVTLAKLETEFTASANYAQNLKSENQSLTQEFTQYRDKAITLQAQKEALDARLIEQQRELEKMQAQLKLEFKNTANTLFEEISKKFSTNSEKQIGDLLQPMQQNLNEFKKLVVDSFTTQGKEQHTLRSEINKIILQADSLTKALRGDVKAQGNWGEVILERILEASGLQKGIGYTIQGIEMGLTQADGGRAMPDVIVHLPDNKHIIVDSKVSLTAYERLSSATDELTRQVQLKEFIKSIRAHANGLASKNYQDLEGLQSPDMVLMFMPIEGAYTLAMQEDRELHSYSWDKRIAIVCPSTLIISLKTIASLWRIEHQNRHAEEIAKRGGALYDKLVLFIEDMQSIGSKMGGLQKDYDSAMNKLCEGNGNLVRQADMLKKLGAKTSKNMPKSVAIDAALEEDSINLIAQN